MHSHLIGVRYCGGCNPRYDRVALTKQIEQLFPHDIFESAVPEHTYDAVLVICGCPAQCVSTEDLQNVESRLVIAGSQHPESDVILRLKKVLGENCLPTENNVRT